jgi:DNA-directed RNA polymerase subunit RPC12/RpoP
MNAYICRTCGVQFAPTESPPAACPICDDERQYVGRGGQQWTTLDELRAERRSEIAEVEPGLTTIDTRPSFAIGQHAHLIQTPAGNLLWESTSLVDEAAIEAVRARGGLAAIAISHPHFYSSVAEWSRAFGSAPIWLQYADRRWVMRPDPAIRFWDGETADPLPGSGLTLIRVGGHFPGSTALLWPAGAEGRGVLLCGDMPQAVSDRRWVSFMYSYPNLIPLPASEIRRIAAALAPHQFDRLYSSWVDRVVPTDAHAVVARSAARYIEKIAS